MDFDLSEDQREIKAVARELLAERSPMERVRATAEAGRYDDALWREVIELGWPGIAVSEGFGGQGLGAVALAVLLEELGYACAAIPFCGTAVAAAVLEACGTGDQRERWLPGLVAGELRAGLGTRELCADGDGADLAILLEGDQARLLQEPAAEPLVTIDPTRRFARLGGGESAEPLGTGAAARVRAALAAELVGVCQRALDMTVAYVKERRQFGVPVGSFQAVAHRCAQMLLDTESARSTAYYAAWAADADAARLNEAAILAAACAGEAGSTTTAAAIQAHGGVGFTWEADVHWLYKRAQLDAALLGDPAHHHAALARAAAAARVAAG